MSHQIQSFCNAVTLPPACPPWPAGSFPLPSGRLAGYFSRVFPPPRFLGHLCRTSLSSLHPGVHTGRLQDRQNAIAACGSDPPGSGGVNGAPLDFQGLLAGVISGRSLILNDHPFSLPLVGVATLTRALFTVWDISHRPDLGQLQRLGHICGKVPLPPIDQHGVNPL